MNPKVAVIDLGTNTFHLLIVQINGDKTFTELFRKRNFVNLAEDGIVNIGNRAIQRSQSSILEFGKILQSHQVHQATILGTAALRTASNGPNLKTYIEQSLGYPVQIITGKEEAELIFKGTKLATDLNEGQNLIMDIGGGSVEFILTENNAMKWAESFPIGITVMHNLIEPNDPITLDQVKKIYTHLEQTLHPLMSEIRDRDILGLIGASGSFEVLQLIKENTIHKHLSTKMSLGEFRHVYDKILASTLNNRLAMKSIPKQRAKLIPLALIMIEFIINKSKPNHILISPYALKEGAISKYLD